MAECLGNFAIRLMAIRIRRCLYAFYGVPHTLLRILIKRNSNCVSWFCGLAKAGVTLHNRVQAHGASKELHEFYDRCTFKTATTKQWWNAFGDSQWRVTDDMIDFAEKECQSLSSRLRCEQQGHYMKNCNRAKTGRRIKRPQRCMRSVVAIEVMTKRFGFEAFPVDSNILRKCKRLALTSWVPSQTDDSVPLADIATTKRAASYDSPVA